MESVYLRRKEEFTFCELLLIQACVQLRLQYFYCIWGCFSQPVWWAIWNVWTWLSNVSRTANCSLWKLWSEFISEMFLVFPHQNRIIHFSAHTRSMWEFPLRWLNYLLIGLLCVVNRIPQESLSLPLSFKLIFVHVCVCTGACHVFWLYDVYYTLDKYPREIM